jgi:AbrB family transcriptional regulator (stage V sporulation protein T)
MKATGIVRRIDDLGRVVIPKEIRRTLRIREGDPLEIFTDREGGVILKKYSPIGELSDFAKEYTESLQQSIGNIVCISDKDSIIAVSGAPKKEYMDKRISEDIERVMEERKTVVRRSKNEGKGYPIYSDEDDGSKYSSQVISPIIAEGDPIGAVIIFSKEPDAVMGDLEAKLAETAASFLGKQMEQ